MITKPRPQPANTAGEEGAEKFQVGPNAYIHFFPKFDDN